MSTMKLEKITKQPEAASRRRYDDACGTAHGMDLVGERWALLVARELLLGPKRFSDLRADLPGLSANVLTQRLEGLEGSGILRKRKLPPPASAQVYELTEWGYGLREVIRTLGQWAVRSPAHDPTMPISATALMLSFTAMFSPERAEGFAATVVLRMGENEYELKIGGGKVSVARVEAGRGDVIVTGGPVEIGAVIYDNAPLDLVKIDGDAAVIPRLHAIFPLPEKARIESS
jgi:DNA-binding HxlR family transcriptional regulator